MNKNDNAKRHPVTTLDKVNLCLDAIGDHAFHFAIMLGSRIDTDRFQRAIRLSLIAEPMYGTRFINHWRKPYWENWDSDYLDNYNFIDIDETSVDPEQGCIDFFLEKMDPINEPFVKARIFRRETDTVALNFNAVAADGYGTGAYMYQIFDIYEKLAANPEYIPLSADTTLRYSKNIAASLRKRDLIKLPFKGAFYHFSNKRTMKNWVFPCKENPEMRPALIIKTFNGDFKDRLDRFRKSIGATINDVMLAAYYKALFEIIQPDGTKPYCVMNTYDLRRYLPPERRPTAANYSSYINTNIRITKDMPFTEIVHQVHSEIGRQKDNLPGLAESPYILLLFWALPWFLSKRIFSWLIKTRGGKVPIFSNAGALDYRFIAPDGVPAQKAFATGPALYPPMLLTGFISLGPVLGAYSGFSENHFNREDIEKLYDVMEQSVLDAESEI